MAQLPKVVTNFTGFTDGNNLAGQIDEFVLPDLKLLTEEIMAGGLAGTVDAFMGAVEKLECSAQVQGVSSALASQFGKQDGTLTARGAISDGKTTEAAIFEMRGLMREQSFGDLKRKDKSTTKVMMTPVYYKATLSGRVIHEIDIIGNRLIIDGKDLLADTRAALGE